MAGRGLIGAGLALAAVLAAAEAPADDTTRVTDGDTLRLGAVEIRLFGIDAPERRQLCARADGTPWPCGHAASARLAELVALGPVRCRPQDRDRYGRVVSICTAGGVDLGGRLVAEGLARAYVSFSDAYLPLEADARAAGLGLWQGAADAPWDYRAAASPPAGGEGFSPAAGAAAIAGLRDQGQRLGRRRRASTICPASPPTPAPASIPRRGEAWFCDEPSAAAAGFRPPRRAR